VRIAGVDVGGMSESEARQAVATEYASRLKRPIVVVAGKRRWTLSSKEARVGVDTSAAVDEALNRSRDGDIISRTVRSVRGARVNANIEPQLVYSTDSVKGLVRRIQKQVGVDAQDAEATFGIDGPVIRQGKAGRALDAAKLRQDVESAIVAPNASRTVRASFRKLTPKQSTAAVAQKYPVALVVDRTNFKLKLYKDLKLVRTYTVAVGQAGLETPAGVYHIQNKAVNPTWHIPNSAWAGADAGKVVPPGPDNPIKARWMGIFAGAGIHGTDETYSLGHAASHGCVRMAIPDVIELYPQVPVGTPIYIA
jgi:lipoprotein-anchoring transpeptidase ErfK/SrfK